MDLTIVVTIISAILVFVSSIIGVFFALRKLSIEDREGAIKEWKDFRDKRAKRTVGRYFLADYSS